MGSTKWTKEQREVIDHRDGNLLVSAAAGSGKTAVLIKKSIKDLCSDMMSGNIKIEPKKSNDKDSCRFCSYSSICQFDTALKNNCYKVIPNRTSDDVIKMMEGDVK